MGTLRLLPRLVVLAGLIVPLAAGASLANVERPASLVTRNLIMYKGLPYVPLRDLARALGGAGRYDPAGHRFEIQPGGGGVLFVNPGPLAAFAAASRSGTGSPRALGPGVAQAPFLLRLAGQEITIENGDEILPQPADSGVSLSFLARLLGGQARFDPGRGAWVLPPGGPGYALAFR